MAKHLTLPKIDGESQPKEYKTKLDGATAELLELYIQAYQQEYGQDVKPGDMIAHIVNLQLTKDRKFRSYARKARQPKMAAAAV